MDISEEELMTDDVWNTVQTILKKLQEQEPNGSPSTSSPEYSKEETSTQTPSDVTSQFVESTPVIQER